MPLMVTRRPGHPRLSPIPASPQGPRSSRCGADLGLRSVLILPEVKDSDISGTIAPTRDGKPVPTGVITYGHMPLMVTRACPLQNIHDCAHCDKTGLLTDRKAKKFPVRLPASVLR